MKRLVVSSAVLVLVAGLLLAGCSQSAATPAQAPASKAAEPTNAAAPAAQAAQPTAAAAAKKVDWPQKGRSVLTIIPNAPGGATDVGARIILPFFEKEFGVPFEAENKSGAGQQIGLTALVQAKPDGYTMAASNLPAILTTYLDTTRKAVYTKKNFQPLGMMALDPVVAIVMKDSPFKTFQDLIDAAKANPKKVRLGSTTPTGATGMAIVELQQMSGAQFAVVGFDGGATMMPALMGGHLDAAMGYQSEVLGQMESGEVRLLGIADEQKSEFAPDVKTLAEQGYKISWASSRLLLYPAGVPKEIVDTMGAATKKALESDDMKAALKKQGVVRRYMSPEDVSKYWDDQETRVQGMLSQLLTAPTAAPTK